MYLWRLFLFEQPLFRELWPLLHPVWESRAAVRSTRFQLSNSWQYHPIRKAKFELKYFLFSYSFVQAIAQHLNVVSAFLTKEIVVVLVKYVWLALVARVWPQSIRISSIHCVRCMCSMDRIQRTIELLDLQLHEEEFKLVSWFLNDTWPIFILHTASNLTLNGLKASQWRK